MHKKQRKPKTYSADKVMRNVARTLIRDFQTTLDDPCLCSDLLAKYGVKDVAGVRSVATTTTEEMDPATYKAVYQIESLTKRYRFEKDLYSDKELEEKAIEAFLGTQCRLAECNLDDLPADTQTILDCAAFYIADLLGEYCDEEHRSLCRFGTKASVGVPAAAACEAARWEIPISGSPGQCSWFLDEILGNERVNDYITAQIEDGRNRPLFQVTDSLKLTLVPKSYKSLRSIMPNTTIGSYMSYGLGEMMRKRLKRKGYDIRTLQERHRVLARMASRNNLSVTADLSAASDSITDALVCRLFPKDWYAILRQSRIKNVTLPGDKHPVESLTFCTMGIGYTFPLQTLVFLALLKAIEAFYFQGQGWRSISVYGDDMIYSRRQHDMVLLHFERIGFVINVDKTFHDSGFRESCGGDYYHGVDVRPFQPRNGAAHVSQITYEAMLYKFINGLLMRWTEHEIGMTLKYLTSELEAIVRKVKIVPYNFPDDSGIKCPSFSYWQFLQYVGRAKPKHIGHGVFRFSFLRLVSETRKEERHEPYLWAALRGHCITPIEDYRGSLVQRVRRTAIIRQVERLVSDAGYVPPLKLVEDTPIVVTGETLTGDSLRSRATHVTVSHTGRYKRQSGTSCFGAAEGDA